jgi:hypothetical protein
VTESDFQRRQVDADHKPLTQKTIAQGLQRDIQALAERGRNRNLLARTGVGPGWPQWRDEGAQAVRTAAPHFGQVVALLTEARSELDAPAILAGPLEARESDLVLLVDDRGHWHPANKLLPLGVPRDPPSISSPRLST